MFVDKTLQGSLKTVEECEIRLQGFSDMLDDSDVSLTFLNLSHVSMLSNMSIPYKKQLHVSEIIVVF